MLCELMSADTGSLAVVNGQASIHPGKETLDELADKERFFRVTFSLALHCNFCTEEQLYLSGYTSELSSQTSDTCYSNATVEVKATAAAAAALRLFT